MIRRTLLLTPLAVLAAASGQPGPGGRQLTARELFYSAAAPQAGPAAAAQPARPARPARRSELKVADAGKSARPPVPAKVRPPAAEAPESTDSLYVKAAYRPAGNAVPLGLKYTLLKRVDGQMNEVAPDTVFHAGDRIQIALEANDGGYLYIIQQGSSGTWKPMFPSAEVEDGNNRVEKGRSYVMPPRSRFYFDEQAGVEKLFVVLSRQPEPDLEKMIYSLREGAAPAPAARPAATPAPAPKVLLASNAIDDRMVGSLRVYARDLVIEKVDDDAPGASQPPASKREKAVYVVNPTGSPDSRVVADIRLKHE